MAILIIGFSEGEEKSDITDLSKLQNLKEIKGNLVVKANELLANFDGFKNLETIEKELTVSDNKNLAEIKIPLLKSIGGTVFVYNNGNLTEMDFPLLESIEGSFCVSQIMKH